MSQKKTVEKKSRENIEKKAKTLEDIREQRKEVIRKAFHQMYPKLKDAKVIFNLTAFKIELPDGRRTVIHDYDNVDGEVNFGDLLGFMEEIKFLEEVNAMAQIFRPQDSTATLIPQDKEVKKEDTVN